MSISNRDGRARRAHGLIRWGLLALTLVMTVALTIDVVPPKTAAAEQHSYEPLTVVTATGSTNFQVEIADTETMRETGLMFRPSLAANAGMLFDFKQPQRVYFWMKNTYVALDMIFIRADGTVARIAENTKPLSEDTVPSEAVVRFVLEVNAGTAARIGLKVGDKILTRLVKTGSG